MGNLPGWTKRGGSPSSGSPIYADDINDLRRWLNMWESRRYGVDSVAYDPSSGFQITANWADDVKHLGAPVVRFKIDSRPTDDSIEAVLPTYLSLASLYRQRGILPFAVLTGETLRTGYDERNAPLDGSNNNAYIEAFSHRAARIAQFLKGVVDVFETWNEPNNWDPVCPNLSSNHFGSMLYYSAHYIKHDPTINPDAKIISGGLFYHENLPGDGVTPGWDYIYLNGGQSGQGGVCTEVGVYNSAGATFWHSTYGGYPWDYLGVHPYHSPKTVAGPALDATRNYQLSKDDPGDIWVSEFGVRLDNNQPQQATELAEWYNLVLGRAYVGAAVWHKHEMFPKDDFVNAFGLTNYNSDGTIDPSQHFDSWRTCQGRTGGF
ncbi:MAG: hypothetical protein M1370_09935 [Bacteroidetes bacterium]|nr:hypothetical protein [Bacteroidota bacterium]